MCCQPLLFKQVTMLRDKQLCGIPKLTQVTCDGAWIRMKNFLLSTHQQNGVIAPRGFC